MLEGKDAGGQLIDFVVSPAPVLAGQTRAIPLWPTSAEGGEDVPKLALPLTLKGLIEWEGGGYRVDTVLYPRNSDEPAPTPTESSAR